MDNTLKKVEDLIEAEKAEKAKELFDSLDKKETVEYLIVKAKLEQKFQRFGEALNALSKVLEIDPDNEEAKNNIHVIQNILNFWNPEMFNP